MTVLMPAWVRILHAAALMATLPPGTIERTGNVNPYGGSLEYFVGQGDLNLDLAYVNQGPNAKLECEPDLCPECNPERL